MNGSFNGTGMGPRTLIPALLGLLLVAGCAGTAPPGEGSELALETVDLVIENDLARNRTLSVRLITNTGRTRLLGTVLPGRTREFTYDAVLLGEVYRIIAMDGRELIQRSREFAIPGPALVEWRIFRNTLVVQPYRDRGAEFEVPLDAVESVPAR